MHRYSLGLRSQICRWSPSFLFKLVIGIILILLLRDISSYLIDIGLIEIWGSLRINCFYKNLLTLKKTFSLFLTNWVVFGYTVYFLVDTKHLFLSSHSFEILLYQTLSLDILHFFSKVSFDCINFWYWVYLHSWLPIIRVSRYYRIHILEIEL